MKERTDDEIGGRDATHKLASKGYINHLIDMTVQTTTAICVQFAVLLCSPLLARNKSMYLMFIVKPGRDAIGMCLSGSKMHSLLAIGLDCVKYVMYEVIDR